MSNPTSEARVRHHFTALYDPLANGTVERLCQEAIWISRALMSEWKLPYALWTSIVDAVHSVINQSPV